jgi:hypothetical protein
MKRVCETLIDLIPNRLLAEPERFALALCFTVIGIDAVVLGAPSSVFGGVPDARLLNLEFGFCMVLGGVLKIVGLWKRNVWMQRLGAAFIILGCIAIIVGVILYIGVDGAPVAVVYALFGVTYVFRLLSSTAARLKLHGKRRRRG